MVRVERLRRVASQSRPSITFSFFQKNFFKKTTISESGQGSQTKINDKVQNAISIENPDD
jgi:hypothetical protein